MNKAVKTIAITTNGPGSKNMIIGPWSGMSDLPTIAVIRPPKGIVANMSE